MVNYQRQIGKANIWKLKFLGLYTSIFIHRTKNESMIWLNSIGFQEGEVYDREQR